MRYAAAATRRGAAIEVAIRWRGRFRAIAAGAGSDPAALAAGFLGLREVFGDDLPRDERFAAAVSGWLERLHAIGARATVAECIA